ncbi:MAG: 1-acyl-sn-glycerol-3-phosphate acyltransferase [Actinomycetota bacterium]|nr:MAG: 1-acyl-sn-glycerol-3-phosphate acyltransferase [Actinomycetota bacterium]
MAIPSVDYSDCEARDEGWWQQDVNAWTSLGFVAVAVVLALAVQRRRMPRTVLLLAALAAAEGVGSLVYHGRSGDAGHLLHDLALIGLLGYVAGWHVGRLGARPWQGALLGTSTALVAGGVAWSFAEAATNVVAAVAVVVVVAAEVLARRRGMAPVWGVALLVLGALAVGAWLIGTSASPACDARSLLQPHGLWHLIAAVLVLAWIDRAAGVADPAHPPRLWRRGIDAALGLLCVALALVFHRSIEMIGRQRIPTDKPVLIVANHANGFVDPILVAALLRRLPRFLGKAALWKVVVARPFLALAGVLPVYRASDGDRPTGNRSTFAASTHELSLGATVAIFPEGTTGDRGGLDRIRTGAARIALGALGEVPDLVLVPIGLAFESRVETRPRAVVMVGEPIAVSDHAPHLAEGTVVDPDHRDVRALTEAITSALESVSPDFESVEQRDVLRGAARTLTSVSASGPATFGEVEVLARRLAATPPERRAGIVSAYRRYASSLYMSGLDEQEMNETRPRLGRIVASAAALALLGSLVLTATLIHLPALGLVVGATALVRSTATKGTVRLLTGLVAGLATWVVAGIVLADGVAAFVAGAAVAVGGALALAVWTPLVRTATALRGRWRARDRAGLLPPVLADRAALVDVAQTALDEAAGADRVRPSVGP